MKIIHMGKVKELNSRCVISLGLGRKGYVESLKRLEESLRRTHFNGDFIVWDDVLPQGSPTQFESPMAFKTFCFLEAQKLGYNQVLWMDAPMVVLRSLEPIFEMIKTNNYVTFSNNYGQSLGQWSSDEVLKLHQISREEAMLIPETPTSVIGLNLSSELGQKFLMRWHSMSMDGLTCRGISRPITVVDDYYAIAWNKDNCVSKDPRVGGHRFDQTAAGIVAHQLGLPPYADNLRDVHFKENQVNKHTILLHHREFGESITSVDEIYYNVFIDQVYFEKPREKAKHLLRKLKKFVKMSFSSS
jgi:hypothetical protein